ncbi:MAG: hypothetical protein KAR21_10870 [Spirochaetales bacterium]|nr:hypothetical protein [Spirochaetales bacterium]
MNMGGHSIKRFVVETKLSRNEIINRIKEKLINPPPRERPEGKQFYIASPYRLNFHGTFYNEYFKIRATTARTGSASGVALIAHCHIREDEGSKSILEVKLRKNPGIIFFYLFWFGASLYGAVYNAVLCLQSKTFTLEFGITLLLILLGIGFVFLMNFSARKNSRYFQSILNDILK